MARKWSDSPPPDIFRETGSLLASSSFGFSAEFATSRLATPRENTPVASNTDEGGQKEQIDWDQPYDYRNPFVKGKNLAGEELVMEKSKFRRGRHKMTPVVNQQQHKSRFSVDWPANSKENSGGEDKKEQGAVVDCGGEAGGKKDVKTELLQEGEQRNSDFGGDFKSEGVGFSGSGADPTAAPVIMPPANCLQNIGNRQCNTGGFDQKPAATSFGSFENFRGHHDRNRSFGGNRSFGEKTCQKKEKELVVKSELKERVDRNSDFGGSNKSEGVCIPANAMSYSEKDVAKKPGRCDSQDINEHHFATGGFENMKAVSCLQNTESRQYNAGGFDKKPAATWFGSFEIFRGHHHRNRNFGGNRSFGEKPCQKNEKDRVVKSELKEGENRNSGFGGVFKSDGKVISELKPLTGGGSSAEATVVASRSDLRAQSVQSQSSFRTGGFSETSPLTSFGQQVPFDRYQKRRNFGHTNGYTVNSGGQQQQHYMNTGGHNFNNCNYNGLKFSVICSRNGQGGQQGTTQNNGGGVNTSAGSGGRNQRNRKLSTRENSVSSTTSTRGDSGFQRRRNKNSKSDSTDSSKPQDMKFHVGPGFPETNHPTSVTNVNGFNNEHRSPPPQLPKNYVFGYGEMNPNSAAELSRNEGGFRGGRGGRRGGGGYFRDGRQQPTYQRRTYGAPPQGTHSRLNPTGIGTSGDATTRQQSDMLKFIAFSVSAGEGKLAAGVYTDDDESGDEGGRFAALLRKDTESTVTSEEKETSASNVNGEEPGTDNEATVATEACEELKDDAPEDQLRHSSSTSEAGIGEDTSHVSSGDQGGNEADKEYTSEPVEWLSDEELGGPVPRAPSPSVLPPVTQLFGLDLGDNLDGAKSLDSNNNDTDLFICREGLRAESVHNMASGAVFGETPVTELSGLDLESAIDPKTSDSNSNVDPIVCNDVSNTESQHHDAANGCASMEEHLNYCLDTENTASSEGQDFCGAPVADSIPLGDLVRIDEPIEPTVTTVSAPVIEEPSLAVSPGIEEELTVIDSPSQERFQNTENPGLLSLCDDVSSDAIKKQFPADWQKMLQML